MFPGYFFEIFCDPFSPLSVSLFLFSLFFEQRISYYFWILRGWKKYDTLCLTRFWLPFSGADWFLFPRFMNSVLIAWMYPIFFCLWSSLSYVYLLSLFLDGADSRLLNFRSINGFVYVPCELVLSFYSSMMVHGYLSLREHRHYVFFLFCVWFNIFSQQWYPILRGTVSSYQKYFFINLKINEIFLLFHCSKTWLQQRSYFWPSSLHSIKITSAPFF